VGTPVPTVLLVEDEAALREALAFSLARHGYQVRTAADGPAALESVHANPPDIIILDVMLPGLDGFEVCRLLRRESTVPIIMLTARTDEVDRVVGLEIGADDYVTKPFSTRELLARIKALLRRQQMVQQPPAAQSEVVHLGALVVDLAERRALCCGQELRLKPRVFDLLAFLVQHPNRVFTREQLLQRVWGYEYTGGTRTVDVHVRWLRAVLAQHGCHPAQSGRLPQIETVRGVGYRLSMPREPAVIP
jgi:DNA-binding response OmpR family regulator